MFWQHKKYTYISLNTIESIYKDLHEKQMTQGVYMYILRFGKIDIHEEKTQDHKTYPKWGIQVRMHESSKLDYTSTSNGYK